jgi:uncharacterized protein (TIGR02145 family)
MRGIIRTTVAVVAAICLAWCSKASTPEPVPETHTADEAELSDSGVLTDKRNGKKYRTALIGGNRWMAENLNYKSRANYSWCYNDDTSYCDKYGRLYDWKTATTVCPSGWHLPAKSEWDSLGRTVGGILRLYEDQTDEDKAISVLWRGAGANLKARHGWKNNGNDPYNVGFSALPGGRRNLKGDFIHAGVRAFWWTSTEKNDIFGKIGLLAYNKELIDYDGSGYLLESHFDKSIAASVRCVHDPDIYETELLAQAESNDASDLLTRQDKYLNDNKISIAVIEYKGNKKVVNIPARLEGKAVTVIMEGTFRKRGLTGVTIPNSVKHIGNDAFTHNNLTNIVIPESVTEIGWSAFSNNQLTNITLPSGATYISSGVFSNNQLTNVIIPDGMTRISSSLFYHNNLTDVIIPKSVTHIKSNAFAVNQLTDITIPAGVKIIGEGAFWDNQLTNIAISNGVVTIGSAAFGKNRLTDIVIPPSVTNIGPKAFADNPLTCVTIGANVTLYRRTYDEEHKLWDTEDKGAAINEDFDAFYNDHGRKAGVYTLTDGKWRFEGAKRK